MMNPVDSTICDPAIHALRRRSPRREVMRQRPPRATRPRPVSNRVEHLSGVMQRLLEVRQPEWHRDHIGDDVPLVVGEIGGVALTVRAFRHAHVAPKTTSSTKGPRNPWNTL